MRWSCKGRVQAVSTCRIVILKVDLVTERLFFFLQVRWYRLPL